MLGHYQTHGMLEGLYKWLQNPGNTICDLPKSFFDDSYHIRNLVVELSDFRVVPEPVHT